MKRMRSLLWFLIATILVFSLVDIGLTFENEPDGFRGLKWGDPPSPQMEFIAEEDEWTVIYRNPTEERKLGDARFDMIIYVFYASSDAPTRKLMSVVLYFRGEENFDILETICKVKFGEPTNESYQYLGWASLSSMVLLGYDSIDETGYLDLGSMPISQQYNKEKEKKQAEEAEEDW